MPKKSDKPEEDTKKSKSKEPLKITPEMDEGMKRFVQRMPRNWRDKHDLD